MTREEVIAILIREIDEDPFMRTEYREQIHEALNMAITSLEAWEKVRQEINDLFSKPACYIPNYDAYKMFLEIIDRHLQKINPTGEESEEV